MTKREYIIGGLESFLCNVKAKKSCEINGIMLSADDVESIVTMLKAQEPKPPVIKENAYGWKFFYCPSCGREFYTSRKYGYVNGAKFCDKCGQAVKWE